MRYAIISDIHASIEGLTAVLGAIDSLGADAILCLGDIVGRFASPNECLHALRERRVKAISGNHDRATVGTKEMTYFSERAVRGIELTRAHLSVENHRFLLRLPMIETVDEHLLMFHAALHPEPNDDIYLTSPDQILLSLNALKAGGYGVKLGFFGHTHVHGVHRLRLRGGPGAVESCRDPEQKLFADSMYLINPGSVAQPRDGDARASFLIYDRARSAVHFHRVAYDVRASAERARRADLSHRPPAPAVAPPPAAPRLKASPSSPGSRGAHAVSFEPPDVVVVSYTGDLAEDQMSEIAAAIARHGRGAPRLLAIHDMTRLGAVAKGIEAAVVESTLLTRGAAFVNASAKPQLLHALIAAAYRPAHRDNHVPLLFFDTQAEARGWIEKRRKDLATTESLGARRR